MAITRWPSLDDYHYMAMRQMTIRQIAMIQMASRQMASHQMASHQMAMQLRCSSAEIQPAQHRLAGQNKPWLLDESTGKPNGVLRLAGPCGQPVSCLQPLPFV